MAISCMPRASIGPSRKTGQKIRFKIRENDGSYLGLHQFNQFLIWRASNFRKRSVPQSPNFLRTKIVKSKQANWREIILGGLKPFATTVRPPHVCCLGTQYVYSRVSTILEILEILKGWSRFRIFWKMTVWKTDFRFLLSQKAKICRPF